jgi:hypothetical protein
LGATPYLPPFGFKFSELARAGVALIGSRRRGGGVGWGPFGFDVRLLGLDREVFLIAEGFEFGHDIQVLRL